MKTIQTIFLTGFVLMAGTALAQKAHIELKSEVFKEIEIVNEDGSKTKKLVAPEVMLPKQEVLYITTFKNTSNEPADGIVINNPIPNNSIYKAGSAFGSGTEILYSADGGKTFAKPNEIKIKTPEGELRTANPNEYTDIRWVYQPTLQPGDEGTVTFRTIIE